MHNRMHKHETDRTKWTQTAKNHFHTLSFIVRNLFYEDVHM